MASFIKGVISTIVEDEELDWYLNKPNIINDFTMVVYMDLNENDVFEYDNEYTVIKDILSQINLYQYNDMMKAIDDGLQYELAQKVNTELFDSDYNLDKITEMMEEIKNNPDIQRVVQMGIEDGAIKKAQNEIKASRAK
jgi:hypothetical protein